MPIIVPIEENHEGIAGLTDAQFRAPDYSRSGLEALGAGLTKIGQGGEQFASTLDEKRRREFAAAVAAEKLDDDHQRNIDDAAVKKAYVDYSDQTHEALHGDAGLFKENGVAAHAAFPDLVGKLIDNHDNVLAQLDDVQRGAVAPVLGARLRSDVYLAANHVRAQGKAEQQWQVEKLKQAAARDAVAHADDPDLHDHHLATGENAIIQQAKIDNISDKIRDKQLADYRSNVLADTVDALAATDPTQAANWFSQHADSLSERDKLRVTATLAPMLTETQAAAAGLDVQSIPTSFQPRVPPLAKVSLSDSPEAMEAPQLDDSADLLAHPRRPIESDALSDAGSRAAPDPGAAGGRRPAAPPETVPAEDGDIAVLRPTERRAPFVSAEVDGQVVLAAEVGRRDAARLSGRDIVVTPEMRAIAQANIDEVRVRVGDKEKTSVAYLMPDGTVQVRPLQGRGTVHGSSDDGDFVSGHTSGGGKPLFVIHGHIEKNSSRSSGPLSGPTGDDGMVDNTLDPNAEGYGDTHSLMRLGIPVATVYNGYVGWHEMRGGQLLFSAPKAAFVHNQSSSLQDNLNSEQKKFLTPRPRHRSR
jgi:predicted nuclease of predicted toxin-antitoxin system